MTRSEHNEHCKNIAETLEKYASGDYFEYDGDLYPIDSEDEFWNTENNSFYLDDDGFYYYEIDGEKIDERDIEPASLWDYFNDDSIYDIDYILDRDRDLKAVRVMVACGGPNIYINTWDRRVELYWWGSNGNYDLSRELCDKIDDYFREVCF